MKPLWANTIKHYLLLFSLLLYGYQPSWAQSIAHSHNDYEQARPLFEAIQQGFQSIEIDILRDGTELKVTHDNKNLHLKPSIERLYLQPLQTYLQENEAQFWLLIDIKSYDLETLDLLHELISQYDDLFQKRTHLSDKKQLQILLSGDIPRKAILANTAYSYFFIDGRISDLAENYDPHLMPLISSSFEEHVAGKGKPKAGEIQALKELIERIHQQGKKVRFWKTPDRRRTWKRLSTLGVDVISVDKLRRFAKFNRRQKRKQ